MSARKAKEAYLRRHGQGKRLSHEDSNYSSAGGYSSTEEVEPPTGNMPTTPRSPRSPTEPKSESWAQRRKQHVLHRAMGERSPREISESLAASLAAVQFAAKLKESVKAKKAESGELSWKQKRAQHYKLTHGVPRAPIEDLAVSTTAVLFAARLKKKIAGGASKATEGDVVLTSGGEGAQEAATKPKRPSTGEKTWTQLRKEAFMRKYGRQRKEEVTAPDVAVSAVQFAAKLRARQAATAASKGSSASVDVSDPA